MKEEYGVQIRSSAHHYISTYEETNMVGGDGKGIRLEHNGLGSAVCIYVCTVTVQGGGTCKG